jgi:hypothetical protein
MPEQIMKTGRDPPRAECMKEDMIRIGRFVGVVFVKQFSIFRLPIKQSSQLLSERFHLVRENADSAQVPMLVKEIDLLLAELVLSDRATHVAKKRADEMMMN